MQFDVYTNLQAIYNPASLYRYDIENNIDELLNQVFNSLEKFIQPEHFPAFKKINY